MTKLRTSSFNGILSIHLSVCWQDIFLGKERGKEKNFTNHFENNRNGNGWSDVCTVYVLGPDCHPSIWSKLEWRAKHIGEKEKQYK